MDVVYTVDLVIMTGNGVPLIKRKHDPFKDMWAIPGGHVDEADYSNANGDFEKALQTAALREAKEEAIEGELKIVRKIGVYDAPGRDPRGNYVSHAYLAELVEGNLRPASDAKEVKLFSEMPVCMAFDHEKILRDSRVFERF